MAQVFGEKSDYLIRKDKHHFFVAFIILFLLFFFIAGYFKVIGNYSLEPNNTLIFIFVFLALFFLIKSISEKHLSISLNFSKGRHGEYEVCDELRKLPDSYSIFRNLKVNRYGDVDLVVLGPTGIFTIEVKSHGGKIDCSGDRLTINGKNREKNFLGQAMGEAMSLRDYLLGNGVNNIFVEPVLVFSNEHANMHFGFNKIKNVYVIKKGFLKDLILNNRYSLSSGNIVSIKNELIKLMGNT